MNYVRDAWARQGCPSLRQVAELAGVSHTAVASVLNGEHAPTLRVYQAVSTALGVSEDDARRQWLEDYQRRLPGDDRVDLRPVLEEIRDALREIRDALRDPQAPPPPG